MFDVKAFLDSLPIMGEGMLGIFGVCLIIIGCVYLIAAINPKDKNKKTEIKILCLSDC